jgi:hypothetical protein
MAIATDLFWHGTFTAVLALYVETAFELVFGVRMPMFWLGVYATVNWVLGAWPDLAGLMEIYAFNTWTIYTSMHVAGDSVRPEGKLHKVAKYIPQLWGHLMVDRFFHNETNKGQWWGDMKIPWAILWVVNAGMIVGYVFFRGLL